MSKFFKAKAWGRITGMAAILVGLTLGSGIAQAATPTYTKTTNNPVLDQRVMAALDECKQVSESCANQAENAAGILVFPDVLAMDLLIGGAGGSGALIENGKITGYYTLGLASAGLEAGIENTSQVYIFPTEDSLSDLKQGSDWKVGATAGVTLIDSEAIGRAETGNVMSYIFDSEGLHGGVSLDLFDIWKTGEARPRVKTGSLEQERR